MVTGFVSGFLLGGSLIIAIGAQNAFVLRQGLLRKHVLAVALFCAVSDALLILAGVAGFGQFVLSSPMLLRIVQWGGAAFLLWYALVAARRAFTPQSLTSAAAGSQAFRAILLQAAAFTWLNPHVYLDTVVLLGGISATYGAERFIFAAGAMVASFIWFFALAYGARLLEPVFARPRSWMVLDLGIAIVLTLIAFKVLFAFSVPAGS